MPGAAAPTAVLLLPNQWYDTRIVKRLVAAGAPTTIYMWEDPVFYGDREVPVGTLRLNKLRLAHHYVGHRALVDRLRASFGKACDVVHVTVDELWPLPVAQRYARLRDAQITLYDPCDALFMKRLTANVARAPDVVESPSFLMTAAECRTFGTNKKRLQQRPFLDLVKKKLGVLVGVASQDAENRRPFPKGAPLPPLPYPGAKPKNAGGWAAAAKWLEGHPIFGNNPGPAVPSYPLPVTSREARAWLSRFLRQRLGQFGPYEDAIVEREKENDSHHWLYHSGISVLLNRGLLTPEEVVKATTAYYRAHDAGMSMASYEGFLRQVMGWREYARMYYLVVPPAVYRKNVFGMAAVGHLSKEWYSAEGDGEGLPAPVAAAIRDGWSTGYLHHIRRLMVVANHMTLAGAHPDVVYRWMYEFALDSDDWVMVFNVYSMGTWSDGGLAMRKPYVSSSAYLVSMGAARGAWTTSWDDRYRAFLKKHAGVLKHTILAKQVGWGLRPPTALAFGHFS